MRKVLLTLLAIVTGITALSLVGPLFGLAISAAIVFASIHFYTKTESTFLKVVWVIIGIFAVVSTISNIPGLVALVALAGGYWIYKKWDHKDAKVFTSSKSNDPFTNFENQWNDLQK